MSDLPNIIRWTPVAKQRLVAMVARGEVTQDEACRHYRITAEEFETWQRDYPARLERVR